MKIPFSKRHKKIIESENLKINFSQKQKTQLISIMSPYNETFREVDRTNWATYETSFEKVFSDLKGIYGYDSLKAYVDGEFVEVNELGKFIRGTKPDSILDSVELFYGYIIGTEDRQKLSKDLNQWLKMGEKPLRFLEGEFIRMDSEFLESEILFKTESLLRNKNFTQANYDFLEARRRLSSGDYEGCIIFANNSLESFLKKLLNIDKENQGSLKKGLIKSGIIPDYFGGFLENLDGLIQSVFTIANKSVRHGKIEMPEEKNLVNEPVAGFCLNMVGVFIVFIIDRYINQNQPPPDAYLTHKSFAGNDELPF